MSWSEWITFIITILSFISMWFMWVFSYKKFISLVIDKQISRQTEKGKIEEGHFTKKLSNDKRLSEEGCLEYKNFTGEFGSDVNAAMTNLNKNLLEKKL